MRICSTWGASPNRAIACIQESWRKHSSSLFMAHHVCGPGHILRCRVMNASAPLKIVALNGCWENAHPDVVYVPEGFGGFPYWMVFTPYPLGNDRFENPTLRASHDGMRWQRIPKIPEPLVPTPNRPDMHNADPEIVFHQGRLYVIYLTIQRPSDAVNFNVMSCNGDLRWSKPRVVYQDVGAVSPTFSVENGVWHVWFIRINSLKGSGECSLVHREGSNMSKLENERQCSLTIPRHVPWHVDIQKVEGGYEALVAAFPVEAETSRTRLFHLSSRDGLTFSLSSQKPLIAPSFSGWDNRMIYRSSFLKDSDGTYRIWYTAASWGFHLGIGLLQGSLHSLGEPDAPLAPMPSCISRLREDFVARLKYEANRHFPHSLISLAGKRHRINPRILQVSSRMPYQNSMKSD